MLKRPVCVVSTRAIWLAITDGWSESPRLSSCLSVFVVQLENDTLNPILQQRDIEVDEQAKPQTGQSQIRQQLCLEHRVHLLDRLEFGNDSVVH